MGTNFPMGYIQNGRDFSFYQKLTITSSTFGGNNTPFFLPDGYQDGYAPDMLITFSTQGVIIINEDSSAIVQVSFNGNTVHEELNPAISRGFTYDNRVISPIWFRLETGASAVVSVRAWSIR